MKQRVAAGAILSGWLLGIGSAVVISIVIARTAAPKSIPYGVWAFLPLAGVSVALMVVGTFSLLREHTGLWVSALLTIPLAALQAAGLLCAAYAIGAFIVLFFSPLL